MKSHIQPRSAPSAGAKRNRGFTLVELLVVMAVMVLLAAILFPALATVREQARKATCLSNLQQLGKAQLLYLQDWDERFPDWIQDRRPGSMAPYSYWTERLQPYTHSAAVFRDPSFAWPPWPVSGDKLADFALLTWGPGGKGVWGDPYWCWPGPQLTLAQVVRPAETFDLMDGYTTTESTEGWHLTRHGRGMNVAFVDGHAHWMLRDEVRHRDTDGRGFWWWHYATADR
jgi:prepilin-type N-terminal cleavage/methylation domain-containing protein/prepilin-type processing-associated H-X9-DG protein